MTQIEINNKEYFIPETWNEIRLDKFLEYYQLTKGKDTIDSLEYHILLLSLLMECPKEELEGLFIEEIKEITEELKWLDKLPEPIPVNNFEIINESGEVVRYCTIENNKLKANEQITLESLLKSNDDNTLVFPELLAVLFRPAIEFKNKETGKIEYKQQPLDQHFNEIQARAEIFKKKLFIGDIYGAIVFFSNIAKESSTKTMATTSSLKITRGVKSRVNS